MPSVALSVNTLNAIKHMGRIITKSLFSHKKSVKLNFETRMSNKISPICDKVIKYSFYLLFFLIPLILTPWNYELFEFNKMILTYLLTTIIVAAWLVKMARARRFLFRRTVLDIPLILFFASQFISTLFSIDRHISLWGYYSRFNGGLFSTISYLLLYWAYVSNLDKKKTMRVVRYTLISAILVCFWGIPAHFGYDPTCLLFTGHLGVDCWTAQFQPRLRIFSTLGQPNWLAAWLVALTPLTWSFALNSKIKVQKAKLRGRIQKFSNFYMSFLFLIFYFCILFTKSRSGFLGFGVAFLIFWGLVLISLFRHSPQRTAIAARCDDLKHFLVVVCLTIFFTLLFGSPWTPSAGQLIKKIRPQPTPKPEATVSAKPQSIFLITASGDIRKIVWRGAIEIWKHYPLFGTGVETFAYSYYWYRPRAHNDVSEWDFLYNKAHNEYLTILANTGAIGLLTYLGIISVFIVWILRRVLASLSKSGRQLRAKRAVKSLMSEKSVTSSLVIALLAGYISILVTNFFGFSVAPVSLLFFLMPAMAMTLVKTEKPKKEEKKSLEKKQQLAIIFILLLALYIIFYLAKFWYADTRFAVAEKLDDAAWYEKGYNELQTAIKLHSGESYYHSELAYSLAGLATLADKTNDASLSAQLAEMAITESDQALKISPYHLNLWKKRAKMLILLASVNPKYQQDTLKTLLRAAELAPTDAKIFYNLGLLYSRLDQRETAIKTLEKTIELKPNYAKARYALALLYKEKGKIKEAKEELKYILEKINPADIQAKNKLKEL